MAQTTLSNLVNPQVMADMISATLPKKIKFSKIAKIDTTLAGRPGNTITVPKFAYIGDAEDVAEGVAIGTSVLTHTTTTATVKKAGKAVELTDEAVLSGYGDPMGEATAQLAMSIAAKVDNDCYDELLKATLVYAGSPVATIDYDGIVDANAKFGEENDNALNKIIFIHPAQEADLRKDSDFIDKSKSGMDVIMTGTIGIICGCQVVKSKKVVKVGYTKSASGVSGALLIVAESATPGTGEAKLSQLTAGAFFDETNKVIYTPEVGDYVLPATYAYYMNPIVIVDVEDANEDPAADKFATDTPALTIYLKKAVGVESDRDILKKTTVASADEHYVSVLSNDSKVVLAKFKA